MDTSTSAVHPEDPSVTEGELWLVRQAILMVASGGTPRVIVAGLRYGDLILERCEHLGIEAGVTVVALPTRTTGCTDLAVAPAAM